MARDGEFDVARWLGELGLGQHAQAFVDNDIDAELLPDLTDADLRELGVVSLGHRKRLLRAIASHFLRKPDQAALEARWAPDLVELPGSDRRQVTVLFCDLVGSTMLANKLDAEDYRAVIRAYEDTCAAIAMQFDGHLSNISGDGAMFTFGYPRAGENDAERAVRAALELATTVAGLKTIPNVQLAVRVGVATGLVVTDHGRFAGDTPAMAARLQHVAAPGQVVISSNTQRLVGKLFDLSDLGPQELKGFAEPQVVFRVDGESRRGNRFEALRGHELTPLIGREDESEMLLDRFERARNGDGQVVLLSGEPGIGKSRIVHALRDRLSDQPCTSLACYCSPSHTNSAFFPITSLLERAAAFERQDPPEARLEKLEALLAPDAETPPLILPLVASLMGLPIRDTYPAVTLSPEFRKKRTIETLVDRLFALAQAEPVLLFFEDAHWADPTTLEALDHLIERVRGAPILVVITYRTEFQPTWRDHAHVTHRSLARLNREGGAEILTRVAGGKQLPAEVQNQILDRTEGVPLFVEELTRTVLESGLLKDADDHFDLAGPLPLFPIPATLQDSLMARLDRLAEGKEIAQLAAVVGREFGHEKIAAISNFSEDRLLAALAENIDAGLMLREGDPPQAVYTFRHALIQDAAYQSLLTAKRREYHARIAQVYEKQFPEIAESQPELVANHYTEAGRTGQALHFWRLAGRRAAQRSANTEAIKHLTRGLELLAREPASAKRAQWELELLITLGPVYMAKKGHGAIEVERTYSRARDVCRTLGDTAHLARVLAGLCAYHTARGPFSTAYTLAGQLVPLAEERNDQRLLLTAQANLAVNAFLLGRFEDSRAHLEQGLALSQQRQEGEKGAQDLGVTCNSYAGLTLFSLGYPDQARERSLEAVRRAREIEQPFSLAFALYMASFIHKYRREPEAALQCAEEGIAVCTENGFPLWLGGARIHRGWALAELGRAEIGLFEIRKGMSAWLATGAEVAKPHYLAMMADIGLRIDHRVDGLALLDEALTVTEQLGDRFYEAEIHRLQGELLMHRLTGCAPDGAEAHGIEASYRRALDVARRQKAKSWELRAATSLARMLQRQERPGDAREILAPVYEWFTEGHSTQDLSEAKLLLDTLT